MRRGFIPRNAQRENSPILSRDEAAPLLEPNSAPYSICAAALRLYRTRLLPASSALFIYRPIPSYRPPLLCCHHGGWKLPVGLQWRLAPSHSVHIVGNGEEWVHTADDQPSNVIYGPGFPDKGVRILGRRSRIGCWPGTSVNASAAFLRKASVARDAERGRGPSAVEQPG
ncbi:hypothetical protein LY76DRAFT_597562 [Colletotrichum caudatum]|nr:hypothetical protein LY76DRAFT_597562 [Colletotrichum caudatum]